MPRRYRSMMVASFLIAASESPGGVAAQGPEHYDGYCVVRVERASAAQLQVLLDLGAIPLGCSSGGAAADYALPARALPVLEAQPRVAYELRHPDLQALVDAEAARLAAAGAAAGGGAAGADPCDPAWFDDFRPLDVIEAELAALADEHPLLAQTLVVGTSVEGRLILGLRINSPKGPPDKPALLLNGCQHAREWIAPMVVTSIARELLCRYDAEPEVAAVVDAVEFILVPVVNPDGYAYTWPPGPRLWRKNRRDNGDGTFGVDLNRNWSLGWGGSGSSGNPASDAYRGPAPFSEPESAALRDLFVANPHIVAALDFHSYTQRVLSPWGHSPVPPAETRLHQDLGQALAVAMTSRHGEIYVSGPLNTTLYPASGVCSDWVWGLGVHAFTVELRDQGANGFLLPPEEIRPAGDEGLAAVMALATWATGVIAFAWPDEVPEVVPPEEPSFVALIIDALGAETVAPGSARLNVRAAGGVRFQAFPLVQLGERLFEAQLPPAPCGDVLEFYVEAGSDSGDIVRTPAGAPVELYHAQVAEVAVVLADDFETDLGWSVEGTPGLSGGAWERGVPAGDGDYGDPVVDGDGSGQCFLTQNYDGDSDVDGGGTSLLSPPFAASHAGTWLAYRYWHSTLAGPNPGEDPLVVQVLGDGGWVDLETVAGNTGRWLRSSLRLADFVRPLSTTRLRFLSSDQGGPTIVESGVDDVEVAIRSCPAVPGDVNGDGAVTVADLITVITSWGPCPGCPADLSGDGQVDVSDLIAVLLAWGGG